MNNEHFFDVQINKFYIIIAEIGQLYIFFNSFIAGVDFRGQNLTFIGGRFWRLKKLIPD